MRTCPHCSVALEKDTVSRVPAEDDPHGDVVKVDVDVCPRCRGTFLDPGELGTLTGNRDLDAFLGRGKLRPEDGLDCPACKVPMAVRGFAGVTLDACPHCGGMWFDQGEIPNLADAPTPKLRRI